MTRARFSAKALGPCLVAVLSLTAFMATSAQAKWLVGSGTLSGTKEVKIKAHTELVLSVPSQNLKKLCTEVSAGAGSLINSTPLGFILLVLNLTSCETIVSGVVQVKCKPKEPVKLSAKGQVFLHAGEEYILLEGDEVVGGVPRFARIDFPEECALPDTNLSGSAVLECLTSSLNTSGSCLDHSVSHLVQQAPVSLFPGDGLKYGVNAATVSGIGNAELASGEAWSAHV
jgi:hypothetical protein